MNPTDPQGFVQTILFIGSCVFGIWGTYRFIRWFNREMIGGGWYQPNRRRR